MDSILIILLGKIQVYIFHFASIVIKRLETMLWLPDDGSQLGLYVPLGLLETGVGVGLKIVFWIGDIPEEKKYELLSTLGDPGIFHISKKKWWLKCILSHFNPF